MKTVLFGLASIALLSLTGCSDPCGDLKACCVAVNDLVVEAGGPDSSAACDAYDEADSDACQAVIDAYEAPAGVDLPDECNF